MAPHQQGRLPDLPHPGICPQRYSDHDALGLVNRRQARPGWQTIVHKGGSTLYLFYGNLANLGVDRYLSLETVAVAHTAGAFMITAFFFIYVYLTTTGHTVFAHIKAMITGWEDADEHHA